MISTNTYIIVGQSCMAINYQFLIFFVVLLRNILKCHVSTIPEVGCKMFLLMIQIVRMKII